MAGNWVAIDKYPRTRELLIRQKVKLYKYNFHMDEEKIRFIRQIVEVVGAFPERCDEDGCILVQVLVGDPDDDTEKIIDWRLDSLRRKRRNGI